MPNSAAASIVPISQANTGTLDAGRWRWKARSGCANIPRPPDKMRVPDTILKCVGFVAEVISDTSGDSFDHVATGFFVSMPSDNPDIAKHQDVKYFAFVTAAHVARGMANTRTAVIVNRHGGGVTVIKSAANQWYFHPNDPSVDVAVVPINLTSDIDIMALPVSLFVNKKLTVGDHPIGLGDEVYMPGLFTFGIGNKRNNPIVRYGNLAMLPDEPIQTDYGFAEVYLIEARSIGGISGSPVFIRPTNYLQPNDEEVKGIHGVAAETILLGLAHGHWDVRESDKNDVNVVHTMRHGVNMGLGIVVPAHKILEVINQPALVEARAQADTLKRWESIPTPDVKR